MRASKSATWPAVFQQTNPVVVHQFLARNSTASSSLAALVPRPRLHLICFHGVLAPNAMLRSQIVPGEADSQAPNLANVDGEAPAASTRARMSWAQLLKRVFAIDITTCPQCGGTLTLPAAIEDPAVIIKILTHLGLPSRAPPRAPARLDAFMQTA